MSASAGLSPGTRLDSRLAEAVRAVDELPALSESRARLARRVREDRSPGRIVAAVESDPGLAVAVLRAARDAGVRELSGVASAVAALSRAQLARIARAVEAVDYFEHSPAWGLYPQSIRLHAIAVQRIADRVSIESDFRHRDELLTGALLHDLGKLALAHAHGAYPERFDPGTGTPEQRLARERAELGADHAAIGGMLARRWGLSQRTAHAIEQHHADNPGEAPALLGFADMLAHHAGGRPIEHRRLIRMAYIAGLTGGAVRKLLYGLPQLVEERARQREPSPLSRREREVLELLAAGRRYKEIGPAIGMAESTVRTHINNAYKKLGVVDRAQAVLLAKDRGWI